MRTDVVVRFLNVQKTYDGQHPVLSNFTLDIYRGEFLTLLGPSGSGKTTTLMLLAGFEAASSGDVFLNGLRINDMPPHKRNLGVVFQNYALFPHMSVAENLSYPLEARGIAKPEIQKQIRQALNMVRLSGLDSRRPAQLSGGQQQRVAVARALVFNPDVVLMDEPLGALDKQLRGQMQEELKRIHREVGATVVYVTHDQDEALTMSDRIAVFCDGKIQQIGSPKEVYKNPANSFVASFVGENNILSGTIVDSNATRCAVRLDSGAVVFARKAMPNSKSTRAILSVRPESIVMDNSAAETVLEGTVMETVYHGDHTRLRISIPTTPDLIVKMSAHEDSKKYERNQIVKVGWSTVDCVAFDH